MATRRIANPDAITLIDAVLDQMISTTRDMLATGTHRDDVIATIGLTFWQEDHGRTCSAAAAAIVRLAEQPPSQP